MQISQLGWWGHGAKQQIYVYLCVLLIKLYKHIHLNTKHISEKDIRPDIETQKENN